MNRWTMALYILWHGTAPANPAGARPVGTGQPMEIGQSLRMGESVGMVAVPGVRVQPPPMISSVPAALADQEAATDRGDQAPPADAARPMAADEAKSRWATLPGTADDAAEAVSETTTKLIDLRDMIQLALEDQAEDQAAGQQPGTAKSLTTVARRLGEILALDQVESFEDSGVFDADRQHVVDTMSTDDMAKDYRVAASVRPGYSRSGKLLRRQDVILFRINGRRAGASG